MQTQIDNSKGNTSYTAALTDIFIISLAQWLKWSCEAGDSPELQLLWACSEQPEKSNNTPKQFPRY